MVTWKAALLLCLHRAGLALVKQLLQQGDTVVATARSPQDAPALQQLAASSGGRLHITALDTSKPESIEVWAEELQSKAKHVDVSCAGLGVLVVSAAQLACRLVPARHVPFAAQALAPLGGCRQAAPGLVCAAPHPAPPVLSTDHCLFSPLLCSC